ncbi:MAG: MFS transporter [Pseudomonas sp.]
MLSKAQKGILVAATTGNLVGTTPALFSIFGLVLIPIAEEFDWPRAQVSGALGIVSILSGVLNLLTGPLLDRFGARRLALAGSLCFGLALALFTTTGPDLVQFYALFILAGIASAFCSAMIYSKVVAGWFDAGRGAALGFTGGVGNGLGAALLPALAGAAIALYGWRAGYLAVALVVLLLGFPTLSRWLRDPPRPTAMAGEADGASLQMALRGRLFWTLLFTVGACAACLTAMFSQVVPVLAERGIGMAQSIPVLTVFSLVCAAWQVGMGSLLDRAGTPWAMAPFYLIAAAGLLLLQHASSTPALLLAGAMMGLGLGTEFGALPLLVSRYFGLRNYGSIAGVMYATITVAQGLVPLAMNRVFDLRHTYAPALHAVQGLMLVAALTLLLLPRFGRERAMASATEQEVSPTDATHPARKHAQNSGLSPRSVTR